MIQDKLRKAQERLLNRRLKPNRVTAIMHNIRLIELGFKKLSLVSFCGFKKIDRYLSKILENSSVNNGMGWFNVVIKKNK